MNKAVDPVAQLLLTLNIGIPVIPNGYKALCPQVESPLYQYQNSMKKMKKSNKVCCNYSTNKKTTC